MSHLTLIFSKKERKSKNKPITKTYQKSSEELLSDKLVEISESMEANNGISKWDLAIINDYIKLFEKLDYDEESIEFDQLCFMEKILKRAKILEQRQHLKLVSK